jgi:hypothetical protein
VFPSLLHSVPVHSGPQSDTCAAEGSEGTCSLTPVAKRLTRQRQGNQPKSQPRKPEPVTDVSSEHVSPTPPLTPKRRVP